MKIEELHNHKKEHKLPHTSISNIAYRKYRQC